MFPPSEQLTFIFALSLFAAFYAACFSMTSRSRVFAAAALAVFLASSAYGIWRILNAGEGYEGLGYLILVAINLAVLVVGGLWVIVLHFALPFVARIVFGKDRWEPRRSILVSLAIAPAFLMLLQAAERQSVPEAPCSTESVELVLGTRNYVIFPELRARIEKAVPETEKRLVWHYSNETRKKENMATICRLSENGSKPIPVDLLWLTPVSIKKRADALCADGSERHKDLCAGLAEIRYEHVHSIKISEYPDGLVRGYQSWFRHGDKPNLLTGGNLREGFVCHGTDNTVEQITCNVWRPIDSSVSVLATSMGVRGTTKKEILSQVRDAVDFTLARFSR